MSYYSNNLDKELCKYSLVEQLKEIKGALYNRNMQEKWVMAFLNNCVSYDVISDIVGVSRGKILAICRRRNKNFYLKLYRSISSILSSMSEQELLEQYSDYLTCKNFYLANDNADDVLEVCFQKQK